MVWYDMVLNQVMNIPKRGMNVVGCAVDIILANKLQRNKWAVYE